MRAEVRVAVFGAAGRLGSRVVELCREAPGLRITRALEHPGHPALGTHVAGYADLSYRAEGEGLSDVDVVLDVSLPEAAAMHAQRCAVARVPLLVATTGLPGEAHAALDAAARSIPVCVAPNLSTGVWVLASLVKQAAATLKDFDVEITETHHRHKKDAPSGTALLLARHVAGGRNVEVDAVLEKGRTSAPSVRAQGSVGVHAVRGGDVVGDHTVFFLGDGERLELTHRAHSRDTFARGALRLLPLLVGRAAGMVGVPELLGLKVD